MKTTKILITMCVAILFTIGSTQAQVAIGTTNTPALGSVLDLSQVSAKNLGLMIPQVNLTTIIGTNKTNLEKEGMVVFNLANKSFCIFQNGSWATIPVSKGFDNGYTFEAPVSSTDSTTSMVGFWLYGQHAAAAAAGSGSSTYLAAVERKGSKDDPKYLLKDDRIFRMHAYAATPLGQGLVSGAIEFIAEENHTLTSKPSKIIFGTTSSNKLGYSQKMVLNADGYLGIGTAIPTAGLHLSKAATDDEVKATMRIDHVGTGGGTPSIEMYKYGATTTTNLIAGTRIGRIDMGGRIGGSDKLLSGVYAFYQGNGTTLDSDLGFYTTQTVRAYINAAGNFGIGTTTPTQKLHVIGNILASGTITPSDLRYKKNVETIGNPIGKLSQIRGTTYEFKIDEYPNHGFNTGKQYGVIAQEVEKVFPELVVADSDGYKSVNYDGLIPVLIETAKVQQKLIEQLEARIKALETK